MKACSRLIFITLLLAIVVLPLDAATKKSSKAGFRGGAEKSDWWCDISCS